MRKFVVMVEYRFEVKVGDLYLDECIVGDVEFCQRSVVWQRSAIHHKLEISE